MDTLTTVFIVVLIQFGWILVLTWAVTRLYLEIQREHNRTSKELAEVYEKFTEHLRLIDRYNWLHDDNEVQLKGGEYKWTRPN